jgi:peroxiredoxin family protein
MFKKMMKDKNAASLRELRDTAIELGVKLMPCQMTMDVMEISPDKLIPQATAPVGVAAMLEEATHSKAMFFV